MGPRYLYMGPRGTWVSFGWVTTTGEKRPGTYNWGLQSRFEPQVSTCGYPSRVSEWCQISWGGPWCSDYTKKEWRIQNLAGASFSSTCQQGWNQSHLQGHGSRTSIRWRNQDLRIYFHHEKIVSPSLTPAVMKRRKSFGVWGLEKSLKKY